MRVLRPNRRGAGIDSIDLVVKTVPLSSSAIVLSAFGPGTLAVTAATFKGGAPPMVDVAWLATRATFSSSRPPWSGECSAGLFRI